MTGDNRETRGQRTGLSHPHTGGLFEANYIGRLARGRNDGTRARLGIWRPAVIFDSEFARRIGTGLPGCPRYPGNCHRITNTGRLEWRTTRSVTLPNTNRPMPLRPWVVITTREGCSIALSMMTWATFWLS